MEVGLVFFFGFEEDFVAFELLFVTGFLLDKGDFLFLVALDSLSELVHPACEFLFVVDIHLCVNILLFNFYNSSHKSNPQINPIHQKSLTQLKSYLLTTGNICWYANCSRASNVFLHTISPSSFVNIRPPKHLSNSWLFCVYDPASATTFLSCKKYLLSTCKSTSPKAASIPSLSIRLLNSLLHYEISDSTRR